MHFKDSPTIISVQNFNAREDAETLHRAIKVYFKRNKTIRDILARRSRNQRLQIKEAYKKIYKKDLTEDLKNKLKGDFKNLILALMTTLSPDFYAQELKQAIKGIGICEATLIDILCALSNAEIKSVKSKYKLDYGKSLESDIKDDTSGIFCRILLTLCLGERDENSVTDPLAAEITAKKLYESGVLRPGTDESIFIRVFCLRNFSQLKLIFKSYEAFYGNTIENAIKEEFSGDAKNALLSIIEFTRNPSAFFASKLYQSMKGLGTNDRQLIRIVSTRCEIDMGDIKKEYAANYGEPLAKSIKGDASGSYKKCLLALIDEAKM